MGYYVTTPIYYVNAEPHLGHAYTTIAADILARHMRQRGEEVFFLTGTDEHGEPVAQVAEREGVSPRELADRNVVHFKEMVERLDCTNDFFIRTTDPRHEEEVRVFMQDLYDRGHIYEGVYEGWYCPNCADFKTEQELLEGNRCPIHKIVLDKVREENYFFRLSSFQEPLERLYAERPDWVEPRIRHNEALSFIRQGLADVSVSRPKLQWGVRVPWDESQVFYVWFDALLNYVTALRYARDENLTERFWPPAAQLIGKDILKFHAVIWPAMLLAAEYELPRRLFIHGYLLMQGEKMSKTLGNVLDPFQVIDVYGVDALRYYCFREVSFGQDGSISTEGFESRYNTELANEYGNLASRTLAMIERYRDGVVPQADADPELAAELDAIAGAVRGGLDRTELSVARGAQAEPLRRGAGAVEAGEGGRSRRAARHSPLWACRGSARHKRPASPLHPPRDDPAPERARAGGTRIGSDRAGKGRRRRRRCERRQARAAVPEGRAGRSLSAPARQRAAVTPRQLAMFLALAAIWGASYLQIKIALDGFDPTMIVFARVALAAVLLYAVVLARGGPDRAALAYLRAHPGRAVVQGALNVAIPFLLISLGETEISSGLTGILIAPGPLFVALFAPALDPSERVGRRGGLGLLIGFAGIVTLVGIDTVHDLGEFLGALAVLGAACCYGLAALYAKSKFRGVPPLVVSFAACVTAAAMTAPPAFATLPGTSPDLGEVAAVVSLGVLGTALAFVLYYSLIAETGAGRAALVGYMIPPAALVYGALLLDENVTAAAIAGLVLILAGIALAGGEGPIAEEGPPPEPT